MTEGTEADRRAAEESELTRALSFAGRALRAWPMIPLGAALAAVAFVAFLFVNRPNYRSETVILYSQGVGTDPSDQVSGPRNAPARLKELLFSRRKLTRVVSDYGLYPETTKNYGPDEAVEELKRHIEFRAPGGDTFSIAFIGSTPSEAQRVTAALASLVIDGDAELRKTQANVAREFLFTEKTSKSEALRAAEEKLAAFMADHRRFALDATPLAAGAAIRATSPQALPRTTLPGGLPQIVYRAPVARAPVARAAPGGAAAPAGSAPAPAPAAPPPDDAERGRAVAALAAARANLAEQLARFTPAHPDVKAAQGAVDRAEARVASLGPEPARVATQSRAASQAAARGDLDEPPAARRPEVRPVTQAEVAAASRSRAAPSEGRASEGREDVVALETEWLNLTRAVTEARQRLDQVEAALFKADILASSERSGNGVRISVIDPAFTPQRPVGFSRVVLGGVFLVVGLFLGVLLAFVRAALDDRVYAARDLERTAPVLVQVPRLAFRGRLHGAG